MFISQRALCILLCSLIPTTLFAQTQRSVVYPGFYLGVEYGYSTVGYQNNFAPGYTANPIDKSGDAARVEAGFDICKNVGVLMSVIYFEKPLFHNINGMNDSKTKNNFIYLAAKGMLPFAHRFVIYADAGIGYIVRSQVKVNNVVVFRNQEIVRPTYGVGLAYLIWKRWILTITWTQATQKPSDDLPSSNYIGTGIRYKFAS